MALNESYLLFSTVNSVVYSFFGVVMKARGDIRLGNFSKYQHENRHICVRFSKWRFKTASGKRQANRGRTIIPLDARNFDFARSMVRRWA